MTHEQPLPPELVALVLSKLHLTYGRRFTQTYAGSSDDELRVFWGNELAGVSPQGIAYALDRLPSEYVPNVLQIRALACSRPVYDELPRLPPPTARNDVKEHALACLREMRTWFENKPRHVDISWAERVLAPGSKSGSYARKLATQVLKEHGRLPR